jgi:hypothetical protein
LSVYIKELLTLTGTSEGGNSYLSTENELLTSTGTSEGGDSCLSTEKKIPLSGMSRREVRRNLIYSVSKG